VVKALVLVAQGFLLTLLNVEKSYILSTKKL